MQIRPVEAETIYANRLTGWHDECSKHFRDFANGPKNWTQGDNESLRIKKWWVRRRSGAWIFCCAVPCLCARMSVGLLAHKTNRRKYASTTTHRTSVTMC